MFIDGNGYRPAFLQSDWLITGPYNTIWTTLFNFCRKPSISQVSIPLTSEILKLWLNFYLVLFSSTFILDKRFVNMRITYQTLCRSCKIIVFVWKMMMPCNKWFTNRVTRSVLEIRSPHFYLRTSLASSGHTEGSSFVFLSTDPVIWLVNH